MEDGSGVNHAFDEARRSGFGRRAFLGWSAGAALTASGVARAAAQAVPETTRTVQITHGRIVGRIERGVMSFKGLPYGGPTGGTGRFMPPRPVQPWKGVRPAFALGAPCYQNFEGPAAWVDPGMFRDESEDCLVLNVWAPAQEGKKRAVMVWLHGGGFEVGSGGCRIYDGHNLAGRGDVVVVTVNHRLNVFGYSYFGELSDDYAAGNVGQLDLIAALKWVRDNIEAFGGDPGCVTIFGQSGGGAKVGTLLAMPAAKGLFHRAIAQSGPPMFENDRASATEVARALLAELGIAAQQVSKIQDVSGPRLFAAYQKIMAGAGMAKAVGSFCPVIDGVTIPYSLSDPRSRASMPSVPMIVGSTRDETVQFINADLMPAWGMSPGENIALQLANDDELRDLVAQQSPALAKLPAKELDRIISSYRSAEPEASRVRLLMEITTDAWFWREVLVYADARQKLVSAPMFYYEFRWRTPCYGSAYSPHGVDLPFVFDNMDYSLLFDEHDTPETRAAADPAGARFGLRDEVLGAWTNFARTGNPSASSLHWPAYDGSKATAMIFDEHSGVAAGGWPTHRQALFDAFERNA